MNLGTLSLIASLVGTIGIVPILGQIAGIWLGKKSLREGTDNGLAKVGIVVGWAGLAIQTCLVCAFLGLIALGGVGNLFAAEPPDAAPPSIAEPEGPVAVEPSGPPVIPTVVSFSSPALLGVECEDASEREDTDDGARVTRVVPGTPAERAGLEVGDVIVAVDNRWINNCADLRSEIRTRSAGDEVEISFRRGNKTIRVSVVLAER